MPVTLHIDSASNITFKDDVQTWEKIVAAVPPIGTTIVGAYRDSKGTGIISAIENWSMQARAKDSLKSDSESKDVEESTGDDNQKSADGDNWNGDINNLPDGWTKSENNGRVHVRDSEGNIRGRTDPPDKNTDYQHKHLYDADGNSLDAYGNVVPYNSPEAHIPYGE